MNGFFGTIKISKKRKIFWNFENNFRFTPFRTEFSREFHEHGNEPFESVKDRGFLDQLSCYQLLKMDSVL
jgi:hypothetical protein